MIKHTKNWFSLSGSIALVAALLTSTAVLGQTVSNSSGFRIEINTPAKYEDRKSKNLRYSPKQQRQAYSFDDPVRIIVRFKSRWRPEGQLGTHAERVRQRKQMLREATRFVARMSRYRPQEVRTFETLPLVSMVIERENLERLQRYPQVIAVQEDIPEQINLPSSLPLVGADDVQTSGYGGEGQTVVIIDTGVDTNNNNPNFTAGQIVAQGCFNPATGVAVNGTFTNVCPGGGTNVTGTAAINQNAGDDICAAVGAVGTCEHGTHVASIAAGVNGVAPQANIISLQVFTLLANPNPLNPLPDGVNNFCAGGAGAQCLGAFPADVINALNEATVLADSFDIAAVNMSLGAGTFNATCDGDLRKVAIDNLLSRGVATVISSGNSGLVNAMGAPACISTAISVGSTVDTDLPGPDASTGGNPYIADLVSSYSNVAPFLDLHAPGTRIVSGAPVNSLCDNNFPPNGDGQCRMRGTSMAAPHVTGAWAALKSLNPAARVEDVLAILQATGVAVADNRSTTFDADNNIWAVAPLTPGVGTQVPRIQLDLAMERFDPHRGSIATGDFNCDGRQDIAMGSPNKTVNGKRDAGEVSILYGSSKGAIPWANRHINQDSKDKNGKKANGQAEAGDRFGHALAAGDFNDDNCDDLAVGIPFESISSNAGQGPKAGMVQVFYGKPWGFDMNMDQLWNQSSQGIWGNAEEGDKFGWSLTTGDFNNDDLDDLAIGTPTESIGSIPASGAVTVIFGHGAGLAASDSQMLHQDNLPLSPEAGDLFGYTITAGDFDNDGYSDLAIGVPRDTTTTDDSGNEAGLVTIVSGSTSGLDMNDTKIFNQGHLNANLESGDRFGFSLSGGDFNKDGFDDLVIGVPYEDIEFTGSVLENAGIIHAVFGSSGGLSSNGNAIFSQNTPGIAGTSETGDAFGYSLASGDFDKDGFSDLAIGVPFEDIEAKNAVNAGAVNIIFGTNGGLTVQGDQMLYQSVVGLMGTSEDFDRFGEALVAGNIKSVNTFNNDLVVRVSGEDTSTSESGALQLFYGKPNNGLSDWDKLIKLNSF